MIKNLPAPFRLPELYLMHKPMINKKLFLFTDAECPLLCPPGVFLRRRAFVHPKPRAYPRVEYP